MPAQTAGVDVGIASQLAEIRVLTESAEPAMSVDQRADQLRVWLPRQLTDHHLCSGATSAERNGGSQAQGVGTEVARLQTAERCDSARGQAEGETVRRDLALVNSPSSRAPASVLPLASKIFAANCSSAELWRRMSGSASNLCSCRSRAKCVRMPCLRFRSAVSPRAGARQSARTALSKSNLPQFFFHL